MVVRLPCPWSAEVLTPRKEQLGPSARPRNPVLGTMTFTSPES